MSLGICFLSVLPSFFLQVIKFSLCLMSGAGYCSWLCFIAYQRLLVIQCQIPFIPINQIYDPSANSLSITIFIVVRGHLFEHSQMVLSIANANSFICTHINDFKYCYLTLIIPFAIVKWFPVGTRIGTNISAQSGSRRYCNKVILRIPQNSSTI